MCIGCTYRTLDTYPRPCHGTCAAPVKASFGRGVFNPRHEEDSFSFLNYDLDLDENTLKYSYPNKDVSTSFFLCCFQLQTDESLLCSVLAVLC
jgi:hypothetical protein